MKNILQNLCLCSGVSGNENNIADLCEKLFSEYGNIKRDFNNNIIVSTGNLDGRKTILLDAHIDQIGFIITDIDDNGFVKVDKCGGVDLRTLLGSPVIVHGKDDLNGVICCMPPHLSDGKEDEAPTIDKIWIDLGLPKEKVIEFVSVGDNVTLKSQFVSLLNNRVSCGALDNRASIAVLLRVCELLKDIKTDYKVVILLSCQEETYGTGAITKSFENLIDEAICVDVSFANQPGVSGEYSNISLGNGPMICYSPTLNKSMTNSLKKLAENNKIPFQIEVCSGRTGTNADHICVAKNGVKTTVLSVPQRNMHTQVEIVDLIDLENTAKLIFEYIKAGGVNNG